MSSFSINRFVLLMLVAISYTFVAADLVKRTNQLPKCYQCQEGEVGCELDESVANKLIQNEGWGFGTQYSTTIGDSVDEPALLVAFVDFESLRGPPPYLAINSTLEKEALVSVHYVKNFALKDGKPSNLTKKAVYKVKSKEHCRGPIPESSNPNTITNVFYECK